MNSMHQGDNELTSTLAREAERFHATHHGDVSMERVLARAGEIRRGRRMRATMVMAAVVLAVAVPVGITALDQDPTAKKPTLAGQVNDDPLTIKGLETGGQPATGWYAGGQLYGVGDPLPVGKGTQVSYLAKLDDAFLVGRYDEASQEMIASVIDHAKSSAKTWPLGSDFEVSADGRTGAFVQPDGTVIAVGSTGDSVTVGNVSDGSGSGYDVLEIAGDCADSCTVTVASEGEQPVVWLVDSEGGVAEQNTGLVSAADYFEGRYAGISRFNEDDMSTCSAVTENGTEVWSTCPDGAASGKRLGAFSPDGKFLLGTYSIGSGEGESEFAILDASNGNVVLDLRVAGFGTEKQGVILQPTWEDDSHVLALIREGNEFAVVRIGLDGEREYALAPEAGIDYDTAPFTLPVG